MADWWKHPCLASLSSPAHAALSQFSCWHFIWSVSSVDRLMTSKWWRCHLETLCCHLQTFSALNHGWHHAAYEESVTEALLILCVCVCTRLRRFKELSTCMSTHANQSIIFGLLGLPNLNFHTTFSGKPRESLFSCQIRNMHKQNELVHVKMSSNLLCSCHSR